MKVVEYFGMKREPFGNDIATKSLLQLPGTLAVQERMDYIIKIGGVMIITGDVGSGKSTSLRWSLNRYHKSEVTCLYLIANSGSSNELYKQICWALQVDVRSGSKAKLIKEFKNAITEMVHQHKNRIVIIVDEASLLRSDVFAELHTITQFNFDSANLFSLVLAGQNALLDKLRYRISAPLASRVVARAHLVPLEADQMSDYLHHHLKVAGIKNRLFSPTAVTAIHQGSGGLLRQANSLARGALVACMIDEEDHVSDEHVRRAASEMI